MKPTSLSICLAILVTAAAPVLRSQDAPKPDAALGTPIAISDGFIVLDGKTYFLHSGQASPVDAVIANRAREAGIANLDTLASSLKAGTMMTMEGKVVAIPSGVQFSKLLESTPPADERAAERSISSQNTTGLAPASKNPIMLGQPGNTNAPPSGTTNQTGAANGTAGSGSTTRNNNTGTGIVNPLDTGGVIISGQPANSTTTTNPDGTVTTTTGTGVATNPNTNPPTTNGTSTTNGTVTTGNPAGSNSSIQTGNPAGTNNSGPNDLRRCDYGLQMVDDCKLNWQDFLVPGAWWPKAVERKPNALRG